MIEIKPHFLSGSGKRSANQKVGNIHLVQTRNGDNFNRALCGEKPTGKSLGWTETNKAASCARCISKQQTEGE